MVCRDVAANIFRKAGFYFFILSEISVRLLDQENRVLCAGKRFDIHAG